MILYTSNEDYLETILLLEQEKSQIRSIDIVEKTGFTKPSVSTGMKKLREAGYIDMDPDNIITLTPTGRKIAQETYERHCFFKHLLQSVGVSEEVAENDACQMEHAVSEESFLKLKAAFDKR